MILIRLLILSICLPLSLPAQFPMFLTGGEKKSVTIPFESVNNLIILPLYINNSHKMNFILDSGLKTAIITNISSQDSVILNYAKVVKLYGMGGDGAVEALQSYGNYFYIPGIAGKHQNIHVLINNIFDLSNKLGIEIHGLIGADIFNSFVVEIDYATRLITFHNPDNFSYKRLQKKRDAVILPLTIERSKPYINIQVMLHDASVHTVKLLIDTGSSDALWLFEDSIIGITPPPKYIESYLGRGLNGEVHGKKARIQSLHIGKYILKLPITAFPDTNDMQKIAMVEGRNGSLGGEVFRRFKVFIDYPHQKITFIKNVNINDKFDFNVSGLEVSQPFLGLPYYEISDIVEQSPAYNAGLQIGDQLIALNYQFVRDMTLSDINTILVNSTDRRIRITVLRNGIELTFKFKIDQRI